MLKRFLASSTFVAALSIGVSPAVAHTVLVNPQPLTTNDDAKTPACGCTFDGTDVECPADYNVTEYEAGETITITWNETINHDGDFRVAFVAKPPNEVVDGDFEASAIKTTLDDDQDGGLMDTTITLPNTPCEECTIQVRQFMMGAAEPYYYTCAAIRILGGTGEGGGEPGTGGTSSNGGASGDGGAGEGASTSSNNNSAEGGEPVWSGPVHNDGCSIGASGTGTSAAGAAFALLTLLGLAFRSKSRR